MANEIKLKRGSGSNPSASDLVVGEVALRTDNGKLFTKKDDNSVVEIGTGLSDGDKGDITVSNNSGTFTIDNGVVTSSKLADNSCTSAKILDGAVGTSKLGGSAVTNAKVASDAAIAGSKISPDFGSQNITTSGGVVQAAAMTIQAGTPALNFTETDADPDYRIILLGGQLRIQDVTNSYANRFLLSSDGTIDVENNLNVGAGLDVTGEITGTSHLDLPDAAKLKLGTGDDLQIYHDGSDSYIEETGVGSLAIKGSGIGIRSAIVNINNEANSENMARFFANGAVELYYDNVKKLETTSDGATLTGRLSPAADDSYGLGQASLRWANLFLSGDIDLLDDDKVKLGNSDDLEIYHDTYHIIKGTTANSMLIQNSTANIHLQPVAGTNAIKAIANGAVELYNSGNKKLEVTSSGIDITGNIVVSGTVDGRDLATDGSKLDGIAAGATNVSNTNQLTNGAGFITSADGGNAATLDSIDSSQFLRSDENDSMAGNLTLTGNAAGEGVFVSIENSTSAPAGVHLKSGHGNWSVYNSKTIADHLELRDESSNTTVMTLNPLHDLGMGDGTSVRTQITSDHSDAANASNRRGFHCTDGPALCHGGGGNAGDRCFEAWSAHGGQAGSNFAKKAFQVNSDGSVLSKNNTFGQISDEKLKQDLVDSPSQWNDIKAVKVKKFRFKEEVINLGEDKAVTQIGVVAQDLEAAGMNGLVDELPDIIDNVNQGTVTKSVKYSVLNIKAIKALQEAMTRIETLESEVAALKAA